MAQKPPITILPPSGGPPLAIVLSEATTPESRSRCFKLASTAFGKSLTPDQYVEREAQLDQHPLTRDGGWRFWYLAAADEPEHVLAMCKTMHRDLLVRDARGGGAARREQGYCIASVVTDAAYRGLGLAPVLLKNVAEWMDGPGGATASILYSDIGEFYVSKGWDLLPALQSTLSVPSTLPQPPPPLPQTRPLTDADLPALCARDIDNLTQQFSQQQQQQQPSSDDDDHHHHHHTLATVLPTADIISWQQQRADYMSAAALGDGQKEAPLPEVKGSVCESAGAWVYWYHDVAARRLMIQRVVQLRDDQNEALARLFLDALEEAARWGLAGVVAWNPSAEVRGAMEWVAGECGIEVLHEKREVTEVPCIRWRNGEKRQATVTSVEFYGWS
ncbi:uncharacterized protein GGS25DRAFT_516871 [Hypoxylon fragiforme]|uniref:uncharacterized protein n=1 Tax=Hypoxylon fragiforme TaxID=63214 RepID=UPI0020C5D486|nr:uncharacterized protein GGS25DRAFT_516871 [Hypoxylon fragiforme]KAI2614017.1 hypothetical protein GGS25DRAFT_516871 [Hypoxylon fragiforme]